MKKRVIAVITGSRAEYGHLKWLMKEIQADAQLKLQVVVTGMHLSAEFGSTYRIIEQDGFKIDAKVKMSLTDDSPKGITRSMGVGLIGFADVFDRLKPDMAIILGDRYEIMVAAQACMIARIPIAHVHGGESTEGLIDESIRHSITKMAHIHFTAAEVYRQRVIQMGENPRTVFNFGAPALDNMQRLKFLSLKQLEQQFKIPCQCFPLFLVTYHPVTLSTCNPAISFRALTRALDSFKGAFIVFTKSNSDTDGRIINRLIDDYVSRNQSRSLAFTSMGQLGYLSAMRAADCVIGNSSSGIYEAPVLKKATVNIGERQRGRLKASSIIDCVEDSLEIKKAIQKALSSAFQGKLATTISLYGQGAVSRRIKDKLKCISLTHILMKKFYVSEGA